MLNYEIVSGNEDNAFILEMTSEGSANLLLGAPLDYSDKKSYILKIKVNDQVQHATFTLVNIHIQDKNSHSPEFELDVYVITVKEDAKPGSIIGKVHAKDHDSGENARLTYTLQNESGSETEAYFSIGQDSGSITLLKELDNEHAKYYSFYVTAEDHGLPKKKDSAKVEIKVEDVNDNQPIFDNKNIMLSVKEDTRVGSILTSVHATDADESRKNGAVEYSLTRVSPADRGYFAINAHSGIITLTKKLDREQVGCYELEVTAKDNGEPSLSARASVTITVEDVNDNPPFFKQKTYYVQENKPVGSIVARIEADDRDIGDNANLEYFIINDGEIENIFYLDSSTGELELRRELDYETQTNYTMNVQIFSGDLQTTEKITIKVVDVNDNKPTIADLHMIYNNFISVESPYKYNLLEDIIFTRNSAMPAGPIGQIPYHDPDVLDTLTFGLASQADSSILTVNKTTGTIKIGQSLDANVELNARLSVFIDDGLNREFGNVNIEVKIVNEKTLENSITVRLINQRLKNFMEQSLAVFRNSLASVLGLEESSQILVLDLKPNNAHLDVTFAARRSTLQSEREKYISLDELTSLLYLNYERIRPAIQAIDDTETCSLEPCENYNVCHSNLIYDQSAPAIFEQSKHVIIRRLALSPRTSCDCPAGYAPSGHSVNLCLSPVDTCWSKPCKNGGKCFSTETGYYCKCPAGTRGENCEYNMTTGRCSQNVPFGQLSGSCGSGTKQCTNLLRGGYQCMCKSNLASIESNQYCDGLVRSFAQNTFLMYGPVQNRWDFVIEFAIKTVSTEGMILYNGRLSTGESDLLMVKLVGGRLYVEFSTGEATHSALIKNKIASGQFENVRISYRLAPRMVEQSTGPYPLYDGKSKSIVLTVQVGNCPIESGKNDCSVELKISDAGAKLNPKLGLDLTGPLFVGGRPVAGHGPVQKKLADSSFVGCLKNLKIDGKIADFLTPLASNNSTLGCTFDRRPCDSRQKGYCANNGKCFKFGTELKCECPTNYAGDRCERPVQVNAKRLTRGYLKIEKLATLKSSRDSFEIDFQLRTKSTSGTVLNWDRFNLYLIDGYVEVRIEAVTHKTKSFVSDTEWHQLTIRKKSTNFVILIDGIQVLMIHKSLNVPHDKTIYLGDRQSFELVGCVSAFTVRNLGTGRSESPTLGSVGTIKDGCSSLASCTSASCPTGAECIARWDSIECRCQKGLYGSKCQPPCTVNQCANGGQCITDSAAPSGFRCKCPVSFTGPRCDRPASCPPGWSGNIPGQCRPCNCTEELGFSNSCKADDINQCECKENYYRPADTPWKCVPCACDRLGAKSPNCSATTGACQCRPGVLGRQCDKCSNKFAEVTLKGCEILNQEVCPRQSESGVRWSRTSYNKVAKSSCPDGSSGVASRNCLMTGWDRPNLNACLSDELLELKQFNDLLDSNQKQMTTKKAGVVAERLYDSIRAIESRVMKRSDQSEPLDDTTSLINRQLLFENDLNVTINLLHKSYLYQNQQKSFNLTMTTDNEYNSNQLRTTSKLMRLYNSNG